MKKIEDCLTVDEAREALMQRGILIEKGGMRLIRFSMGRVKEEARRPAKPAAA